MLQIGEEELNLLLSLGHLHNEINSLTRLQFWSSGIPDKVGPKADGRQTYILFFLRLLGGKIFEGWKILGQFFFGTGLSQQYELIFDKEVIETLDSLKKYFGKKNPVEIIRNNFAFHYSPNEFSKSISNSDKPLTLYLQQAFAPNTLFFFSEVIVEQSMQDKFDENNVPRTIINLMGEFLDVGVDFLVVIDGIVEAIIKSGDLELRIKDNEEIELKDILPLKEIQLPWFSQQ